MAEKKIFEVSEIIESYELNEVFIYKCVEEKWIIPCDIDNICFDEEDISRIRLIKDLKKDFGVNDESIPIILHLIDQLHWMQAQVKYCMNKIIENE